MVERPDGDIDGLVNAFLDGEMTPEETAAFEARVRRESALRRRVELLRGMVSWSRETRPRPPAALGREIRSAIASAEAGAVRATPRQRWWELTRFRIGWRWTLAAAAPAAIAVVLLVLRMPGGPGSSPAPTGSAILPGGAAAPSGSAGTASEIPCEFVLDAGSARQVCLVGDFNRWTVCATPLEREADGRWHVTYTLPPGRHEYMFVVDDEWRTDPDAAIRVDDGFGNQNAVLLL